MAEWELDGGSGGWHALLVADRCDTGHLRADLVVDWPVSELWVRDAVD
jgi:hypothetical protein